MKTITKSHSFSSTKLKLWRKFDQTTKTKTKIRRHFVAISRQPVVTNRDNGVLLSRQQYVCDYVELGI